MVGFTLFTSDYRPRYTNDVLSVLALPEGLEFQFRYEQKYIDHTLIHRVSENKNSIIGTKILIAFRSTVHLDGQDNVFIVPIRWATLVDVIRITDFYILRFKVGNYPELFNNSSGISLQSICRFSNKFLNSLSGKGENAFVITGFTDLVRPDETFNKDSWINICKQLAQHPKFKDTYFLKISEIFDENEKIVPLTPRLNFSCKEARIYYFKIDYYAVNFPNDKTQLYIDIFSDFVKLTTDSIIDLDSRYDSFRTWFATHEIPGDRYAEIKIISEKEDDGSPRTKVSIPIKIIKARNILIYRVLASAIGAVLLALPGLLESAISVEYKILFVLIGSLTLAFGVHLIYPRIKR